MEKPTFKLPTTVEGPNQRGTTAETLDGEMNRVIADLYGIMLDDLPGTIGIVRLANVAGTAQALTATVPEGVTLGSGMAVRFTPTLANIGPGPTLNGWTLVRTDGSALTAGDLQPGQEVTGVIDDAGIRLGALRDFGQEDRRKLLFFRESSSGNTIGGWYDGENNVTYIEVRSSNGGPTPTASILMEQTHFEVFGGRVEVKSGTPFDDSHAFTFGDEAGAISNELILDEEGKFTADALLSIGPRLIDLNKEYLRRNVSAAGPYRDGTWDHPKGGRFAFFERDDRDVIGMGSSSISRSAGPLAVAIGALGANYINLSQGGQVNDHVLVQIGAVKPMLRGNILAGAAGSVVKVTSPSLTLALSAFRTTPGTLAGVPGELSYSSVDGSLIFTRASAGDAVDLASGEAFLSAWEMYRNRVFLNGSGKNDLNNGRSAERVFETTLQINDYLSPFVPHLLQLGHFPNRQHAQGSTIYDAVYQLNAQLEGAYGDRFVDWIAPTRDDKIFADLNISRTPEDDAARASGNIPPSLLASDGGHFTSQAYEWFAANIIVPRMIALGWYKD